LESRKTNKKAKTETTFKLLNIAAKTPRQKLFFQNYKKFEVISLTGFAGTGKSFISLYQALKSIEDGEYQEVLILRSAVPSRDIGFMPGNKKEKMNVYENPYASICTKLYNRGDAYSILKQKNIIKFEPTSFLRGETFENAVVIFDEAQNASEQEICTVLTRLGNNSKLIICGDSYQDDLTSERYKEQSGFLKVHHTLRQMDEVLIVEFDVDDIQRSGFVKNFIIKHYA